MRSWSAVLDILICFQQLSRTTPWSYYEAKQSSGFSAGCTRARVWRKNRHLTEGVLLCTRLLEKTFEALAACKSAVITLDRSHRIHKQSINIGSNIRILEIRAVSFHRYSMLIQEKLFEIAGYVDSPDRRPLDWHRVWLDIIDEIRAHAGAAIRRRVESKLEIRPQRLFTLSINDALDHNLETWYIALTWANMFELV